MVTKNSVDLLKAINVLKELKPGKLPLQLFLEITRLTVTPIVEIVPLRMTTDGKVEVLLTKRENDDPNWAGMFHTPGTVVLASDTEGSYSDAFKRIIEGELKGTSTSQPIFVINVLHKVKRGMESSLVYWIKVEGEPKAGKFYGLDELPENIVNTQVEFIRMAAKDFDNRQAELLENKF